jgi:glycerophosphoryl diester phosphodiesterase
LLTYTVNDAARAATLVDWGLDGIITDRIDTLGPAA